ncbi:MAG: type III-B CRISPR module RAMP protein Cmr1, partial [Opitutae bacterium]|nr:type III-B CRISPR module RAMP protein Cmr1 [Opitutae bacterium]
YWSGQTWHPAALLLPGWSQALAARVGFDSGPFRQAWPTERAERRHLAEQIKPMVGRGDDPLSAFLAYFSEKD